MFENSLTVRIMYGKRFNIVIFLWNNEPRGIFNLIRLMIDLIVHLSLQYSSHKSVIGFS